MRNNFFALKFTVDWQMYCGLHNFQNLIKTKISSWNFKKITKFLFHKFPRIFLSSLFLHFFKFFCTNVCKNKIFLLHCFSLFLQKVFLSIYQSVFWLPFRLITNLLLENLIVWTKDFLPCFSCLDMFGSSICCFEKLQTKEFFSYFVVHVFVSVFSTI